MRYSAQIRTEAVLHLGVYSLMRGLRKIFKKPAGTDHSEELRALKVGIRKIKDETERSIIAHFKDYKENIKFQYIQRLAQAAGDRLYEILTERFGTYVGDVKDLAEAVSEQRSDKERLDHSLESIERSMSIQQARLQTVRQEIDSFLGGSCS
jgi:hypothetical protein